jgi:hypothetical protein
LSYCRCANKFTYENATKQPAPNGWQAKQVWVCGICNLINHAVQEEHPVVRGPANATALLHATGRSTGIHELTWATPAGQVTTIEYHTYPRTVPMSHPEPLLFSLWELLQSKMEVIMGPEPDYWDPDQSLQAQALLAAKGQARGIAEALAILMKPFMENADAVVRAAVAYHKDPSYEVPGLAPYLWDPMYNPDGTLRTPVSSPPKAKPRAAIKAPKPKTSLSAADIAFMKQSLDAGFSKEDLASMYKVSVSEVDAAIA